MKVKFLIYFIVSFFLTCGLVRDNRAYEYDISYSYQGEEIIFHIQNKLGRKIPWRHVTSIGVSLIKENKDHEEFWSMGNVGCDDLNTELKYGATPKGFLVYKNKKLEVGKKYTFYFMPLVPRREFWIEFVYDPPKGTMTEVGKDENKTD
ncbi:hypothetical protein [Leptospira alexanderi]|uniref:Uncharacterized protein n=1 Tax=Leptospira alexanderi serovar Manhao 3 str. L 60 TaxID=1049759 RepID=V6IAD9_9LEPT|nr:hypothetical protein [Leptospira alexanderi]EQA60668.1 hypothetical protein LEP1GSC062_0155 [Leptospira alexanderi serovar Manhao 3 str. L 60]